MSPGRVVVFIVWLVPAVGATEAREKGIRHVRYSKADEFLECAREMYGKPVFASAHWHRLGREVTCEPGIDRAVLEGGLASMEHGMRTFDAGECVYVIARSHFEDRQPRLTWNEVVIETVAERWGTKPQSRQLNNGEMAELRDLVVNQARTTPLSPPRQPKEGGPATKRVVVLVDSPSLRPEVESIVAFYGAPNGVQRLVYGELRDSKVSLHWDSPLFSGDDVRLAYADVNGDGVKEILLNSRYGRDGEMLSIFDVEGEELTRQEREGEDCANRSGGLYSAEGGVCSLGGSSIDLIPVADGKGFDLLVTLGEKETIYSLSGNRYVPRSTP